MDRAYPSPYRARSFMRTAGVSTARARVHPRWTPRCSGLPRGCYDSVMTGTAATIRRARAEDAPVLAEAERAIAILPGRLASTPDEITDAAVEKTILDVDAHGGIYLVAEHAFLIVGHALLEPLSLAATAHVVRLTIAVHEGHQGRGIGRALMEALLAWARANERVEKVELQVRSSNARAIALYRSLGFVEEGRKTRRLKIGPGDYLDDVYMALWVGPALGHSA